MHESRYNVAHIMPWTALAARSMPRCERFAADVTALYRSLLRKGEGQTGRAVSSRELSAWPRRGAGSVSYD